jgi:hypothetical protein
MSDTSSLSSDACDLELPSLFTKTREALTEAARRNNRTVHEEAEHIIKTYLAASGEHND